MTKKQLEDMVNAIQKPNLKESDVRLLLNKEDANIKPIPRFQPTAQPFRKPVEQPSHKPVAQEKIKPVAQELSKPVAQVKTKPVAQEVAQVTWVAQELPKPVAQVKSQPVAQELSKPVAQVRSQPVAQDRPLPVIQVRAKSKTSRVKDSQELLIEEDVRKIKIQISKIQGVDERKNFFKKIRWGILGEKRGKKYYLFGAKKLRGRKYKVYIGNATK